MIQITLTFTCEQAKQIFESVGLEVKFCDAEIDFKNVKQKLPVWVVINPYTNRLELLETAFRRYLESCTTKINIEHTRLEIYKIFSKS